MVIKINILKWKYVLFYFVSSAILLYLYWRVYRGIVPADGTVENIAILLQNTIYSGLTAASITLPMTVGILGYAVDKKINCINVLFFACVVFLISLSAALWNLFRLPGSVLVVNVVSDYQTAVFLVIQLYSLLYGFGCLVFGAWRILKA